MIQESQVILVILDSDHNMPHVLREMEIYMAKEKILPEPGEVKALMAQLDALLDVANNVKKKKTPVFAD